MTNDPNPVRFDGNPPVYEPEPIRLASLFDITGILARSVVAQIPEEKIYYYINDHLGTPQKMVDESGAVVWSTDYLPFGQVNVTVNTIGNEFRFPGQYYDTETGLHYNYHRYYDPKIGRYLTPDPVGLAGGFNLFVYAVNNPINKIDPYGLFSLNDIKNAIFGTTPGDIFTIGFSGYTTFYGLGLGFSFDRVIMPTGEVNWFFTIGPGVGVPGGTIAIDKGFIENMGEGFGNLDFDECDIIGFNVALEGASTFFGVGLGGDIAITPFSRRPQNYIGEFWAPLFMYKGGVRIGTPGAGVLFNWTVDL